MRGILKTAGRISLLIFVISIGMQGIVSIKGAVLILIFGILIQSLSDSLFRIGLTTASLIFFLWSVTGGNFSLTSQVINGLAALLIMMTGLSVMFKGFTGAR